MLCRVWIVIGYCSKSDSHWGRLQESPALDSKGLRGKSRSAPRSAVKCAENRGFRPRLMFERFCGRGRKRKQAVVSTFLTPHSTVPVNREMTCIRQTRGSDRIGELRRPAWVECGPACPPNVYSVQDVKYVLFNTPRILQVSLLLVFRISHCGEGLDPSGIVVRCTGHTNPVSRC